MAKRKAVKAAKPAKEKIVENKPKKQDSNFKLALVVLIFGTLTAFSAVYKMGNITILFGLVTAAAALAMATKK